MSLAPAYPLSAIVGQEDLVEALLVCAVHPVVGGVLVRGERGTAKSTAVRALAPMLPPPPGATSTPDPETDRGPQGSQPHGPQSVSGSGGVLVELPLGATLDRVVGTLDLRAAIGGEHRVEAGLLSRAHGGVLYVDEVNLLADHLVDALLDAAASGAVTVERDGVSIVQEARFILVGTMNPEEGELRPQLLDRFGLGVDIAGPRDPAERAKIVRRRMDYDADPNTFVAQWASQEAALADKIRAARSRVAGVTISERELLRISSVCAKLDLDGVRGDLVCAHAAVALAALDGASEVDASHVQRAAHLALRHRMRRDPLAPPPSGRDSTIDDAMDEAQDESDGDAGAPPPSDADGSPPTGSGEPSEEPDAGEGDAPGAGSSPENPAQQNDQSSRKTQPQPEPEWQPSSELAPPPRRPDQSDENDRSAERPKHVAPPAAPSQVPEAALRLHRGLRTRRSTAASDVFTPAGRAPGGSLAVIDARPARDDEPVAILPTLLAALRGDPRPQTAITGGGRGALLCLIVDTSGSMAARRRLSRVKGALEAALRRAYARRDLVAVVGFSGDGGQTIVAPGTPIEVAAAAVHALPAGGRTPLAAGIAHAADVLEDFARGHQGGRARIAVLLTDGRADDRAGLARSALQRVTAAADRTIVVDLEDGRARLGLAAELAAAAGADLTRLVVPGEAEPGRRPRAA